MGGRRVTDFIVCFSFGFPDSGLMVAQGECLTNVAEGGRNAVTWGVFPAQEVVQTTIIEKESFLSWKVRPLLSTSFCSPSFKLLTSRPPLRDSLSHCYCHLYRSFLLLFFFLFSFLATLSTPFLFPDNE